MKEKYDPQEVIRVELNIKGNRYFYTITDEISGPGSARLISSNGKPVGLAQSKNDVLECVFMYGDIKGKKVNLPSSIEGQTIDQYVVGGDEGRSFIEFYNEGEKVGGQYNFTKTRELNLSKKILSGLRIHLNPKHIAEMAKGLEGTDLEVQIHDYLTKVRGPNEQLNRKSAEAYINQMAQDPEHQDVFDAFRQYLIRNGFMKIGIDGQPVVEGNREIETMKKRLQDRPTEVIVGTRKFAVGPNKTNLEQRLKDLSKLRKP